MLCLSGFAGCSDNGSVNPNGQGSHNEDPSSKVERIQAELTDIAAGIFVCALPQYDYVASLSGKLTELSPAERDEAFQCMERIFSQTRRKEFPLSERQRSLCAYYDIVLNTTTAFSEKLEEQSKAWMFLLRTISVFDGECRIVSAPEFDPHPPEEGIFLTKGMYLHSMENEKFNAVRRGFEENVSFVKYYHRLADEQQKEWLAQLEKVAGRNVVIFDPNNPGRELPRRSFSPPSYLPKAVQEKLRTIRRDALNKAGIDPSSEGL